MVTITVPDTLDTSSTDLAIMPLSTDDVNILVGGTGNSSIGGNIAKFGSSTITEVQTATVSTTWVTESPIVSDVWNDVAWSPELEIFVAVSKSGSGRSTNSSDGAMWATASQIENVINAIVWAPILSKFVAVGTNVVTSTTGTSWTSSSGAISNPSCITWSPELEIFVALNFATEYETSVDGTTWISGTSLAGNWKDITWSPQLNLFVAVSESGAANTRVMRSSNGTTWISTSNNGIPASNWQSVTWSPKLSLFVAVAESGSTNSRIMSSPDGVTWATTTGLIDNHWHSIVWAPEVGLFVAVGRIENGNLDQVIYSSNGTSWTSIATPSNNLRYNGVTWSPLLNTFVAIGQDTVTPTNLNTILKSIPEYLDLTETAVIGAPHLTYLTISGNDIRIGSDSTNVTIGSIGSQVIINGEMFYNGRVSRNIINSLSPVAWIANGETSDRVGGFAVTLKNDATIKQVGPTSYSDYVYRISSTPKSSVDIATTFNRLSNNWTLAWAVYAKPVIITSCLIFVQLKNETASDTNHAVSLFNTRGVSGDEFIPSGGGWNIPTVLPPSGLTKKSVLVVRRNGTGSNSITVWYNGIHVGTSTLSETYNGQVPVFMRIGARNNVGTANAFGFEFGGFAAFNSTIPSGYIPTITYDALTAP
jgi:hypothetical protein